MLRYLYIVALIVWVGGLVAAGAQVEAGDAQLPDRDFPVRNECCDRQPAALEPARERVSRPALRLHRVGPTPRRRGRSRNPR